jgi:hypothetical protein
MSHHNRCKLLYVDIIPKSSTDIVIECAPSVVDVLAQLLCPPAEVLTTALYVAASHVGNRDVPC